MQSVLLQKMIAFRRLLHQYPEPSFQQFQTRKKIKEELLNFGVKLEQMTEYNPTALVVDLKGEAQPKGQRKCIAFRADMDALTMKETNQNLTYKSKNQGVAHMCGHDGHMACLVAFVPLFLSQIKKIPSNKIIRLLFQPSEEGPDSGAKKMVEDGCLEGVDEVYGFHQWPTAPLGELWCREGPVMSESTILRISIIGTSGHGSQPEKCKLACRAATQFYLEINSFNDELMKQKPGKFICSLPVFKTGERFNVISESAYIQGSIRSFEEGLNQVIINEISTLLKKLESKGFKTIFDYKVTAPINSNTKNEAEHILRVGAEVFGKDKVGTGKLPFRASQDFAFFTKVKPGAFFFLSTSEGLNSPMIHNSNFDFNDKLIPKAALFWLKLAQDRLGVSIQ